MLNNNNKKWIEENKNALEEPAGSSRKWRSIIASPLSAFRKLISSTALWILADAISLYSCGHNKSLSYVGLFRIAKCFLSKFRTIFLTLCTFRSSIRTALRNENPFSSILTYLIHTIFLIFVSGTVAATRCCGVKNIVRRKRLTQFHCILVFLAHL